jgi:hypothetical protein
MTSDATVWLPSGLVVLVLESFLVAVGLLHGL